MELDARLGKPCNKILRNLIHVHKYVLAYACVYVARCQRMLQAYVTDVVEYVFMFLFSFIVFNLLINFVLFHLLQYDSHKNLL